MTERPARASVGVTVLVAFGCYATVVAAAIVGSLTVPSEPPDLQDCQASCVPTRSYVGLALFFATPFAIALAAVTVGVAAVVSRRMTSAILAGILSAGLCVLVGAGLFGLQAGLR